MKFGTGIEGMRDKRQELEKQILEDENQQAAVQEEIKQLTMALSRINEALTRKVKLQRTCSTCLKQ